MKSERTDGALAALLRDRLPAGAERFAAAVVRQVAHPLGGAPGGPREELAAARALVRVFAAASTLQAGGAPEPTGDHASPELLSALFQHLDLLYEDGCAAADGISLLLLREAWEGDPDPSA